jgi:saccharopine dehydrogenase (NAD+, L-lysine-forming)
MVTVLVLGGAGIVGSVAVRDLVASKEIDRVVVGDINLEGAREVARGAAAGKASAVKLDVAQADTLAEGMRGCDVVLNCAWYEFNLDVMRSAMAASVDLVDLGGLYHMTRKQLALDPEVRRAGITIVPGCGEDPGITNVMARHAADTMDEVKSIRIRDGDRDLSPGPPTIKFSVRTMLDEFTMDAVVFEGGKHRTIPPLSRKEVVTFPPPVGRMECYTTVHSELATLPTTIGKGVEDVDFMISEPHDLFRVLTDYGLLSTEPFDAGGVKLTPRDAVATILSRLQARATGEGKPGDATCVQVVVEGRKGGRPARRSPYALARGQPGGVHAMAHLTGVAASIGAQLVGAGLVKGPGVVPPESAFDPGLFLRELRKREVGIGGLDGRFAG